jgi:Flp pilus assembly protein TadB
MAEEQQQHRHHLEKYVTESRSDQAGSGQRYAFWLALSVLVVAGVFAATGQSLEALALVVGETATLLYVFLTGKRAQRKELEQKRKQLEEAESEG